MPKHRIVKVQRPIVPHDGPWLAYDEQHEHEDSFYPDQWMIDVMGARYKAYFTAVWSLDEGWQFVRRIKDQRYYW